MAYKTTDHTRQGQHDRLAAPCAGASTAPWRSLSDYFAPQYRMFEATELAALLEPRRIQTPPGYHPTKCVGAAFGSVAKDVVLEHLLHQCTAPGAFLGSLASLLS